jgi:hypothetical protein
MAKKSKKNIRLIKNSKKNKKRRTIRKKSKKINLKGSSVLSINQINNIIFCWFGPSEGLTNTENMKKWIPYAISVTLLVLDNQKDKIKIDGIDVKTVKEFLGDKGLEDKYETNSCPEMLRIYERYCGFLGENNNDLIRNTLSHITNYFCKNNKERETIWDKGKKTNKFLTKIVTRIKKINDVETHLNTLTKLKDGSVDDSIRTEIETEIEKHLNTLTKLQHGRVDKGDEDEGGFWSKIYSKCSKTYVKFCVKFKDFVPFVICMNLTNTLYLDIDSENQPENFDFSTLKDGMFFPIIPQEENKYHFDLFSFYSGDNLSSITPNIKNNFNNIMEDFFEMFLFTHLIEDTKYNANSHIIMMYACLISGNESLINTIQHSFNFEDFEDKELTILDYIKNKSNFKFDYDVENNIENILLYFNKFQLKNEFRLIEHVFFDILKLISEKWEIVIINSLNLDNFKVYFDNFKVYFDLYALDSNGIFTEGYRLNRGIIVRDGDIPITPSNRGIVRDGAIPITPSNRGIVRDDDIPITPSNRDIIVRDGDIPITPSKYKTMEELDKAYLESLDFNQFINKFPYGELLYHSIGSFKKNVLSICDVPKDSSGKKYVNCEGHLTYNKIFKHSYE